MNTLVKSLSPEHPVVKRAHRYLEIVEAVDISGLQPRALSDKVQYEHKHKNRKRKGGHPPIDFNVAESIADLRIAYNSGDWKRFVTLYAILSRMLPL